MILPAAYCPWCGAEIIPAGFSKDEIEWERCSARLCKGNMLTVVTDYDGYIIHPFRKRNHYIHARRR